MEELAEERLAHEKDIGKERLRRLKEKYARQSAEEKLELLSLEKQRAEEKHQKQLESAEEKLKLLSLEKQRAEEKLKLLSLEKQRAEEKHQKQHTKLLRSNSKPNTFLFLLTVHSFVLNRLDLIALVSVSSIYCGEVVSLD